MVFGTEQGGNMFEVGRRLRECREWRGLSRDNLVERVEALPENGGKTRSVKQISYIENGTRKLSNEYALLLSRALNIRIEYLLLQDSYRTDGDRIDAISSGTHEVHDLITELIKLHGYEIVADTFDYEPLEKDENGNKFRKVHYGIKSAETGACAYIGHSEIDRIFDEIDDFIDFKCSSAVNIHNKTKRKNRVAKSMREGKEHG